VERGAEREARIRRALFSRDCGRYGLATAVLLARILVVTARQAVLAGDAPRRTWGRPRGAGPAGGDEARRPR